MEFTANDQIQQYYNYTCLSERNVQLVRRKILYKKEQYLNHFASVIKNTTELNEKLNPKLVINAANLRDVLHDEAFLQIPYDYVMKIIFDLEQSIFSRRNTLNCLIRKIQFHRKQYHTLLMKIFTYNFEINNSKYTESEKEALAASLKTNRCEASLRIAQNVQNCLLQVGKFLLKDNLCNNTSLEFLKQNIQEQMVLIHKTVKIGRPVITDVLALNKELKKLTNTFRINRKRNMRSLAQCKLIMLKERSAIANASMEEIDPKMWSLRFKSMTTSMEAFQNEKENLQVKIEGLKQACLSRSEANVHLRLKDKIHGITQMQEDISIKVSIRKQLDIGIENSKVSAHDYPTSGLSQQHIDQQLEEEDQVHSSLERSLVHFKSLSLLLNQFLNAIPQVSNRDPLPMQFQNNQNLENDHNLAMLTALYGLFVSVK